MTGGRSGEFEPVYLALANVLELHASIIGSTVDEAADQGERDCDECTDGRC